jgi:sigma-B regulation protein RsbU (phosphoserine phosphatase)
MTVQWPSPLTAETPSIEPDVITPLKVLLIEDNAIDARLIQIMLSDAGSGIFQLERAERLSAGLQRLVSGDIGLVLLDLSLPDSQGLATFSRLYAESRGIPIIVMSGLDDQTVAVTAVHEGAQDYLVKGQVSGQLLVRAMRYAIERKRTAQQLAGYAEELRKRNAQMEADFSMAREIQQVFLPRQYPVFPKGASTRDSAVQFTHRYLPAAAVGGDFFNIFQITDTLAGAFICDVMGHGMRAALVTAVMRGLVEQLMPAAADPGQFLTAINHSLHAILEQTEEPMLATAVYILIDLASGELRFANAGHPSPLHIRSADNQVQPLKSYDASRGPALGLFHDSTYPVGRCPIAPNDFILLFTDGLFEVSGPAGQEFGPDRLLHAVRTRSRLDPSTLFDELLDEVKEFSSGKDFEDDVCLIGAEIKSVGPPHTR